jgi:hypothetical protein
MIAKTLFFTKTFQRIRREIYVRRKVFAIMKDGRIGISALNGEFLDFSTGSGREFAGFQREGERGG